MHNLTKVTLGSSACGFCEAKLRTRQITVLMEAVKSKSLRYPTSVTR